VTTLAWGDREIPFAVSTAEVLRPTADASPRLDLAGEAGALAEEAGADGRILVVVPDRTRAFPLARVLPPLVEALLARGAAPERVTIVLASGTHVAADADVDPSHLGRPPAGVRVVRHDPDGPMARCGVTPAGTPVEVHPALVEADRVLALGGTAFHYFAGFGGGGKMLFPGLGARAAVAANHRRSLAPWPPGGLAEGVEPGRLDGNPVAMDLRDVHALLPPAHHLTLWGSEAGFCGERWTKADAFARLCDRYARGRRVGVPHAAEVVIASCGGHPKDLDVVQSHKALFHAARYAKDGARLVLFAACAEGIGSPALARWLARPDRAALESEARSAYDLNAQTAISLAAIAARVRVTWVSSRPLPELERWGFEVVHDCAKALAKAKTRALVLPAAGDVLPSTL
jgi:nickel-dependent lactate racemase